MAWRQPLQQLKRNPLARIGAAILIAFYTAVIFAGFVGPYDPYVSQPNGSLLPPTPVYLRDAGGNWIGPHVYPTTQGPVDLETGDRPLLVDRSQPSPIRLFAKGPTYKFWGLIPTDRHLFGTTGPAQFNLLGTDDQARDQLSRLLHGGRISMFIGLFGVIVSFPLGMLVGGISGYFGGWIDAVLMRLAEVLMTIPSLYLLVSLAAVLPAGLSSTQRFLLIIVITALINWAGLARVIRGQVLSIKGQTYVQAARAMGAGNLSIIVRHILPQTLTYVITAATLSIPSFIVTESVLSIVGLGIQQPDPSWGNMLSVASDPSIIVLQPWLIWPPAVLIVLTVLAFNLLGDGLRDVLDPRNSPTLAQGSVTPEAPSLERLA
ncbi:MAG: ABC transporter permease [Synechococcales cyanobacterium RM1_1_8]|nr:ABC transporter permease [Synechococcales cyanobacterium RM1_1_8]